MKAFGATKVILTGKLIRKVAFVGNKRKALVNNVEMAIEDLEGAHFAIEQHCKPLSAARSRRGNKAAKVLPSSKNATAGRDWIRGSSGTPS